MNKQKPKIYEVRFNDGRIAKMDEAEFYVWFHSHNANDYCVYMNGELVGPFDGKTGELVTEIDLD